MTPLFTVFVQEIDSPIIYDDVDISTRLRGTIHLSVRQHQPLWAH